MGRPCGDGRAPTARLPCEMRIPAQPAGAINRLCCAATLLPQNSVSSSSPDALAGTGEEEARPLRSAADAAAGPAAANCGTPI